jgi:hypothetical protein
VARSTAQRRPRSVQIRSEEEAWALLEQLATNDDFDANILPVIKQWAKVEYTFWIDGQNAVLTAPVMRAMLDLQDGINRAFIFINEGTTNLRSLSEEERKSYEAVFKIKRGSSKIDVDLQELCKEFGKQALEKMTGKQIATVIVAFALLFGGNSYWKAWLEHQKDLTVAEANNDQIKELLTAQKYADEADLKKFELMNATIQAALGNRALIEASDEGRKGALKAAARVDGMKVAGATISPEIAKPMARSARTTSEQDTVTNQYDVIRVDTEIDDGFRVRLRDTHTGEEFFASVRERMLSLKDRDLIQQGEWKKKPIEARLLVTRRRGEIVEARVAEVLRVVGLDGGHELAEND